MPSRVPISVAKSAAEASKCRQVILLGWDGELTHIVTYGKTTEDCAQAAEGGNLLKQKWGWPECNDQPSRVKKLESELSRLRQAHKWIPVSERIPEFEEPVWGLLPFESGKGYCLAIVMRGDGEDGWLWHICNEWAGNMVAWPMSEDADFECDDDYRVKFWMPLEALWAQPDTQEKQ